MAALTPFHCTLCIHAHGPVAKIPRPRHWRVTNYGGNITRTSMHLREHHFPTLYIGVQASAAALLQPIPFKVAGPRPVIKQVWPADDNGLNPPCRQRPSCSNAKAR